jgi:hypothetical protein
VRRTLPDQVLQPSGLLVIECDRAIAGLPWKQEAHLLSCRCADWFPAKPGNTPFCLWVIFNESILE